MCFKKNTLEHFTFHFQSFLQSLFLRFPFGNQKRNLKCRNLERSLQEESFRSIPSYLSRTTSFWMAAAMMTTQLYVTQPPLPHSNSPVAQLLDHALLHRHPSVPIDMLPTISLHCPLLSTHPLLSLQFPTQKFSKLF